jgi:predicted AAA+ superfamily ATPase
MVKRLLTISFKRSFFLFGARGSGKSTLLKELLPSNTLNFDLLDPALEHRLAKDPSEFIKALDAQRNKTEWVLVDEIQKNPTLLGYVHQEIRKSSFKFALTGSSARKLKKGSADMLAGRANWYELYPLTSYELKEKFDLSSALHWGTLPEPYFLDLGERRNFLRSYVNTYLKEEVIQEQLIRKVQPFRNFLELAAIDSGKIINFSKFAKQAGTEVVTIQSYYEILEDTLIGFSLLPFSKSLRKRQRKNPKFYFFDLGVARALSGELGNALVPRTSVYGHFFEQFLILEIYRLVKIFEMDWKLSYLMTGANLEIDLIIEQASKTLWAIEIKSTQTVDESEVLKLETLAKDIAGAQTLYLSCDPLEKKISKTTCLHWTEGLKLIFGR